MEFIKLYDDVPTYPKTHDGDAGMDLPCYTVDVSYKASNPTLVEEFIIHTGIAVAIPQGYVGLLLPRSSTNRNVRMVNNVGIIDNGYRGELRARFVFTKDTTKTEAKSFFLTVEKKKFLQLVVVPFFDITPQLVSKLPETSRGDRGFGSTGV